MDNEKTLTLLAEIRDSQVQLLEEYRRVAGEALSLQRQALELQRGAVEQQKESVEAQVRHLRLYRIVLIVAIPIVAYLLWILVRIM